MTTRGSSCAPRLVARATARPVCDALREALRRHGVPEQILTDNGKVFTARFGRGPGPVLFDRICADNGIRHLLTAPYSPTTTGKIERLHKTMRAEFFAAERPAVRHDRRAAGGAGCVGERVQHRRGRTSPAAGARRRSGSRSPTGPSSPATADEPPVAGGSPGRGGRGRPGCPGG